MLMNVLKNKVFIVLEASSEYNDEHIVGVYLDKITALAAAVKFVNDKTEEGRGVGHICILEKKLKRELD